MLDDNNGHEVVFNDLFPDDNNADNTLMLFKETGLDKDKEEVPSFKWWSLFNAGTDAEISTLKNDWSPPSSVYDDTGLMDNKRRKVV